MEKYDKISLLIDKIEKEMKYFEEQLACKTPKEVMKNAYKLTCMQIMCDYLVNRDFTERELKILIKKKNLLEYCYNDWEKSHGSFINILEESVDDTIILMKEKENKKKNMEIK